MSALPQGTVTLQFTDIEGSTRLLHELGPAQYGEALAGHRRIVRTQGDGGAAAAAEAARHALALGED